MARAISIPDPNYSDKEFSRYYHYDLADMAIEDLVRELVAIRYQLWLLKSGRFECVLSPFQLGQRIQWLQERISRTKIELSKREYVRRGIGSEPEAKPKLAEGVSL